MQGIAGGLRTFVSSPGRVLPPYRPASAPIWRFTRYLLLLGIVGFVGMIYGAAVAFLPQSFYQIMMGPLALLGIFVIWAVPTLNLMPSKTLTWLLMALTILSALWPNYLAFVIPGLPWISMRRLVSAPMYLVLFVAISASPPFRARLAEILSAQPLIWKLVVAYVATQIIALPFSGTVMDSVNSIMNSLTQWTLIFFVSAFVFSIPGTIERWVRTIVIVTIPICLITIPEYQNQRVLWADHIPSFLRVNDPAVELMLSGKFRQGYYRVQSTFGLSLSLAEYLALVSPFIMYLVMRSKSLLLRAGLLALDALAFGVILYTGSRLGLAGFIAAHVVFVLVAALRAWKRDRTSLIAPATILSYPGMLVLLGLAILFVPAVHNRVLGGGDHQFSTNARRDQWGMAIPKILSHPLGHGPGYGVEALNYRNLEGVLTLDSYFLLVLLDTGIVGFLTYYGMLAFAAYKACRLAVKEPDGELSAALPVGCTIVAFITTRYVLILAENVWMPMMLVGMTVAMHYRSGRARGERAAT